MSAKCKKCGKRVDRRNLGSGGGYGDIKVGDHGPYGYVRCRVCTREMLKNSCVVGDGFLRLEP